MREHLTHFHSSNVKSAVYSGDTHELTITFKNGGSYSYAKVTPSQWHGLQKAKSKGHYVFAHIQSAHTHTKNK